jgi:hypothetical protein
MDKVIELTTIDRIALLDLLPNNGNFITLGIITDLQKELSFNEKELKALGIVIGPGKFKDEKGKIEDVPPGHLRWHTNKDFKKKFTLGPKAFDVVFNAIEKADREENLSAREYGLYMAIVKPVRDAEEREKLKRK